MSHSSKSNHANHESDAHPWLQEKVYVPKRQRTAELVKRSVDALLKEKQKISLSSIAAKSKIIDPDGQGISESAILVNEEAQAYYALHRSWKGTRRTRQAKTGSSTHLIGHIKLNRDVAKARQRYMRMSKENLADRLMEVEQAYAEHQGRWLAKQDELLAWRLRAEQAETHLKQLKTK